MELRIPKLPTGTYFQSFIEPRRRAEKARTAVIQDGYIQGVSTRSVDDLVKAMGMSGIYKSQRRLLSTMVNVTSPTILANGWRKTRSIRSTALLAIPRRRARSNAGIRP